MPINPIEKSFPINIARREDGTYIVRESDQAEFNGYLTPADALISFAKELARHDERVQFGAIASWVRGIRPMRKAITEAQDRIDAGEDPTLPKKVTDFDLAATWHLGYQPAPAPGNRRNFFVEIPIAPAEPAQPTVVRDAEELRRALEQAAWERMHVRIGNNIDIPLDGPDIQIHDELVAAGDEIQHAQAGRDQVAEVVAALLHPDPVFEVGGVQDEDIEEPELGFGDYAYADDLDMPL